MQEDEQKVRVLEESIARWAVWSGPEDTWGPPPPSGMGMCLIEGYTAPNQCGCGHRSCLEFPPLGVLEEGRYHHQSP